LFIVCNEASVALLGRSDQWLRFMTVCLLIDFHLCECCFSDALNVNTCWWLNWVTQPSVVDSKKMHNCNFVVEVDGYISTQKQETLKRWEYERLCLRIHAGLVGGDWHWLLCKSISEIRRAYFCFNLLILSFSLPRLHFHFSIHRDLTDIYVGHWTGSSKNNTTETIQDRIHAGNKVCYAYQMMLKNRYINRGAKL
jgi:hypothetical protein